MSAISDLGVCDADVLGRLLSTRRSCRAFRPDPVDGATVKAILQAAQCTASWCNTQPWHVIVTRAEQTEQFRQGLIAAAASPPSHDLDAPAYDGIYLERRRAVGWQLYDAVGVQRGDRAASHHQAMQNYDLFGAPHVAIVTSERALGSYGALDCGGFIQAFMLTAHAMGVATIAQASIAFRADFVRAYFALPESRLLLCGISFGFANDAHSANSFMASRAPLEQAVTWCGDW